MEPQETQTTSFSRRWTPMNADRDNTIPKETQTPVKPQIDADQDKSTPNENQTPNRAADGRR
jgi:hypothetical protein